jgi:isopentenyldiphosphate isomerase
MSVDRPRVMVGATGAYPEPPAAEGGDAAAADELLVLCDAHGRPLDSGVTCAPRAIVHRDGLWHRSFHCWVVRAGPRGPELLLQRRALTKDFWPGAWDVSAAGHYRAGEGLAGGLRELAEELGLTVPIAALVWLGRHKEVVRYAGDRREREYQDVYLVRCDRPLSAYAPDAREVTGLALVPPAALVALARGARRRVRTLGWVAGPQGWAAAPVVITRATLVPRAGRYYERVARAAWRLLHTGAPPLLA